jgi:hypothetical protein
VNHDHIKGKDVLRIQNALDATDSLLTDCINNTNKPVDAIATQLLYDTSIITQLAKKSTTLSPTFQILILAIQLKCISHIFKKNSLDNSDFFKFWRNLNEETKNSHLSKIDSYSVHNEYFYLQKTIGESNQKTIIINYLNLLLEFIDFNNEKAQIEIKTNIDRCISASLMFSKEYLKNITNELLRENQLVTSDDKIQIPSASELRSIISANTLKNEKFESKYFQIISKSLDFLEQTALKIFQTERDLADSDNTITLSDYVNQLCNLTRVYHYVYLLLLKLQESTLKDDMLSFQTIAHSLEKLEILNTKFEDSVLNKLDSIIELNQKSSETLIQMIDYARKIFESINQTNKNLNTISKNLETLEKNLNQAFKHSLNMLDFSLHSGFLILNQQIHDLNKKVNLQTLISSVNYYKDSKIKISINRELSKI